MSNQPQDFGLDVATRLAVHEILLTKLYGEMFRRLPNAQQELESLRQSLVLSFEVEHLNAGGAPLNEHQQEWVRQQSLWGQELSEKFVGKVKRNLAG